MAGYLHEKFVIELRVVAVLRGHLGRPRHAAGREQVEQAIAVRLRGVAADDLVLLAACPVTRPVRSFDYWSVAAGRLRSGS